MISVPGLCILKFFLSERENFKISSKVAEFEYNLKCVAEFNIATQKRADYN